MQTFYVIQNIENPYLFWGKRNGMNPNTGEALVGGGAEGDGALWLDRRSAIMYSPLDRHKKSTPLGGVWVNAERVPLINNHYTVSIPDGSYEGLSERSRYKISKPKKTGQGIRQYEKA